MGGGEIVSCSKGNSGLLKISTNSTRLFCIMHFREERHEGFLEGYGFNDRSSQASFNTICLELIVSILGLIHCKKRLTVFPSQNLVSDIPAGDGKMANLFYSVVPMPEVRTLELKIRILVLEVRSLELIVRILQPIMRI
jgi:hypothetical protein